MNKMKLNVFSLIKSSKKTILGYGASTKGNVVLNYCDINPLDLNAICDQNPEKPGLTTPVQEFHISKSEIKRKQTIYLFNLAFQEEVLNDEKDYIMNGGTVVFALPRLHFVNKTIIKNI